MSETRRAYQRGWYRRHAQRHRRLNAQHRARRRAQNRAIMRTAKAQPCADCGKRYPYYVMDFDHRRGQKTTEVAKLVSNATPQRLRAEIAKCDVVCANCHRERTHGGGKRVGRQGIEP
jgi:hypothetical protein